ncbi:MAG: LysM peptidoglycan-binding domain-containing protein [Myxococcales bacterium FL481]|nr:MAG: LysM peptidoglycan-binding domain-containing protein [Myxococcales bacterium FL481]
MCLRERTTSWYHPRPGWMSLLLASLYVTSLAWIPPSTAAQMLHVVGDEAGEIGASLSHHGLSPAFAVHWRGDTTELPSRPRWIEHRVTPRERLTQISARYGVRARQVRRWNELADNTVETGQKLRIRAQRVPPPRLRIEHVVRPSDTWGSIAASYRIETRDLHAYNWRVRRLEPGMSLVAWIDPGRPWTVYRGQPAHVRAPDPVPPGARSIGRPNRGRLVDGVQLPSSDAYTIREPRIAWGSSWAIRHLLAAVHAFRSTAGYQGELVIKSMSRQHGRRFPPHRSHQSGRDVDIALPLLPGVPKTEIPHPDEVDWEATWALVSALIDTREIDLVFLDISIQRRLYEAARGLGASHDQLRPLIQFPRERDKEQAVVRHGKGHLHHIHVRFTCAPYEDRCRTKSR